MATICSPAPCLSPTTCFCKPPSGQESKQLSASASFRRRKDVLALNTSLRPTLSSHLETGRFSAAHASVADLEILKADAKEDEAEEEDIETAHDPSAATAPNAFEIQSLLMELCDETSIAELKIKVGKFHLHVKRKAGIKEHKPAPVFYSPPVPSFPMADALAASPAPAAPAAPAAEAEPSVDEGLLYVLAPKVGIVRRGRIYKGKRGRNLVDPGSEVKKGQVVCYLEQLGTQEAVESEHAGEVIKFLADEGEPVGYGDALLAVRPSFPGIKKLA